MCRHLAWLGEPRTLASLVLVPEHGLLRQSYEPRRQSHGIDERRRLGRGLPRPRPPRPTGPLALLATAVERRVVRLRGAGAARRVGRSPPSAPPRRACRPTRAPPRRSPTAGWLLSHNGRVDRACLPAYADAESVCDSAVLAAHVFASGVDRVADTVADVAARDPGARLSLLLADPDRILAVTWGDPLSYLVEPDGVAVASEPWDDDPRWVDVPDHHHLEVTRPHGATAARITVTPLETP